ncbi:hypothetical protein M5D96_001628 [Drosophila gunungcola]|uniref:Uncharacterized protein n=1 Tax=Drosophila gunungcola TaxID=103775 RepID=A0A9P9YYH3_9MUSC|nr:hypothetical protein M5D96_001628 [Drosophila gunungcola]
MPTQKKPNEDLRGQQDRTKTNSELRAQNSYSQQVPGGAFTSCVMNTNSATNGVKDWTCAAEEEMAQAGAADKAMDKKPTPKSQF